MSTEDDRAALLSLFSMHMPEVHEDDGEAHVACSCGSGIYVGHLVKLILDRLNRHETDPGIEVASVTIWRWLTEGDLVDRVDAADGQGEPLPLTEALGMMRLAEDTLIRQRMGDDT